MLYIYPMQFILVVKIRVGIQCYLIKSLMFFLNLIIAVVAEMKHYKTPTETVVEEP